MTADKIRLLFDVKQMRPACILLQAVAGGDGGALNRLWPSETWLVAPTDDMRMIAGTEEQWRRLPGVRPLS